MGNTSKTFALFLTLIIAMSCLTNLMAEPVNAQTITKPSIPNFTLKYVVDGYNVPTTYKTDPYNGSQVVDQQGYHVNNSSIVVTIENQLFEDDNNGLSYHLFYNVRYKGHFSQEWITEYCYGNFTLENINPKYWYPHPVLEQEKNSVNTTACYSASDYPTNAQLDFQVKAVMEHEGQIRVYSDVYDNTGFMIDGYIFDQESEWSNIQTINLADGSVSVSTSLNPTASSSPTLTVPELSWLAIVPLLLSVFVGAVIVRHRKTAKFKL